MSWNKNQVWGYPTNLSLVSGADSPFLSSFTFNMIVKKHKFSDPASRHLNILSLMTKEDREQFETDLASLTKIEKDIRALQESYSSEADANKRNNISKSLNEKQSQAEKYYLSLMKRLQTTLAFRR
jgi:hypothetical protein